jgi:hypothetical protein
MTAAYLPVWAGFLAGNFEESHMTMKRIFTWTLLALGLAVFVPAYAADTALSGLPAATAVTDDDLFLVSDDPGGTPASKKVTANIVRSYAASGAITTGSDANTTMAVNTTYVVDMSGWATADRTYTLPTSCAVGDRIKVLISTGNGSTFELILTAAASDTLNGVAGGTEWSRLFITGEFVTMMCITANSAWMVVEDGRIAQKAVMRLSTSASGEAAATVTSPTAAGGAWTADYDNAALVLTASDSIKVRRAGVYTIGLTAASTNNVSDGGTFQVFAYKNGDTDQVYLASFSMGVALPPRIAVAQSAPLVAGDFVKFRWLSSEGGKGLVATAAPLLANALTVVEVLR